MFVSLIESVIVFSLATLVIIITGSWLARLADELADRSGLGEALFGVLLLAGITSLPDFAATLSAAVDARPDLAMSNAMGSIAVNIVFLGIADIIYRKANLEHAAASQANLMLASLLVVLLTLPLIAMVLPASANLNVHPVTPIIILAYLFGMHLVYQTKTKPMWFPRVTRQTVEDEPGNHNQGSDAHVWGKFVFLAIVTGLAGWVLMESAKGIADYSGLSDTVIGGILTALSTSAPELVTTIAAIRIGALTLAMSNIIGTNCFNMLVVASADIGYPNGSIYNDLSPLQLVWGLVSILMTAILLLGMLRRETYGIGRIGFESAFIMAVYIVSLSFVIAYQ